DKLTIAKMEGWFKKFETIAKFYNWGEKAYEYVPLFLEDKVQVAYDRIPLSDRIDLNKVKASLIHSLLTQDPFEAFNSRDTDDWWEYCGPQSVVPQVADALARNQFLRGIDIEVAEKLRVLKLQTLDEMVERAEIIIRGKEAANQQKQELSFYAGYYPSNFGGKGKGKGNYNGEAGKGFGDGAKGKGRRYPQKDPFWFKSFL
ncbi:hypothetical protein FOZ62_028989, partial [Perkinsus olseni]